MSDPPMTTIASGFCVCAPMPFESAAGERPSVATSVVMSTGRNRFSAASRAASSMDVPLDVAQPLEVRDDEDRVLDRDAEDRDEAHRGRDREVDPGDEQREDAAGARDGDVDEDDERVHPVFTARVDEEPDEQQRERDDDREARRRLLELVDLARPLEVRVVGELDLLGDLDAAPPRSSTCRSRPRTENFTGA